MLGLIKAADTERIRDSVVAQLQNNYLTWRHNAEYMTMMDVFNQCTISLGGITVGTQLGLHPNIDFASSSFQ